MSKVGQAVFEGQEFAQENYNVPREQFVKLAGDAFKNNFFVRDCAVAAFDEIQSDLSCYQDYMEGPYE